MGCFLQKVAVGKLERLRTSLFPMGWDGAGIKVLAQQCWWCTRAVGMMVLVVLCTGLMVMVW